MLNQLHVDRLTVVSGFPLAIGDGSFVQLKGSHDRLQQTALDQERGHLHEEECRFPDPAQGGPVAFAEGLAATGTTVSLLFPIMYDDIAATKHSAGVTARIRAELRLRVHLATPLFGDKSASESPLLFNQRYSAVLPQVPLFQSNYTQPT